MTNYERLFGTPERMARFIFAHCGGDCFACLLPETAPCFHTFTVDVKDMQKLLEWLNQEVAE